MFNSSTFYASSRDTYILIFVILAIILIFVIAVLINLFAKKQHQKKIIRDLEKKYEASHAILVGQDSQFVRRLEIISQYNLLYVDIHQDFLRRYEYIKNEAANRAENAVGILEDLIEKNVYHGMKENIKQNRQVVLEFEELVRNFNCEIKKVLKAEDECRVKALAQKEKLRLIKQEYFQHQSELFILEDSFNIVFANIDKAFENFEDCLDHADYDQVASILTRVDEVLIELNEVMKDLPILCSLVENVVPSKIRLLREAYNRMTNENYPVHHLKVNFVIDEMNDDLSTLKERLLTLSTDGMRKDLIKICDRCERLMQNFEEEKNAKVQFEENCDNVYSNVNKLEKDFIKLCNFIPDVKNKYLIEESYLSKIDIMRGDISRLGVIKRTLDNFIHSATKQPYSLLVNKMTDLDVEANTITASMNSFDDYLNSLEKDTLFAIDYITDTYFNLKNAERDVRNLNVDTFIDQLKFRFNECYSLLDNINAIINNRPVNVKVLNEVVNTLKTLQTDLLKEIENKSMMCLAAESMVVYANKDRSHLSDVNILLCQTEMAFFEGDFEKSYLQVGNIVKKIQGNNN